MNIPGKYAADARRYDELLDGSGRPRAHWRPLIAALGTDSAAAADIARRGLAATRQLVAENGVTYNVYADPQGAERPWALDPLPLVIPAAEWALIERGVAQRARLLDALLADLYGPQRLLAEGLAPPELPFGHPNFLWPAHGSVPRDGRWLHIYAADLARAPDGRWWVLADRTQAPSGAGYALGNREIVQQVLSDAFRDLNVRRLQAFAGALREQLLGFAPPGEQPLAVVLTPGPFNETYFEHAYLARQLGLPLVEGSDLTVRGDTVFLKTLAGLKRVHGILRRLDDDFCDPLELRSDSALGVPGLLGAVRARRVTLANALGSGVLESAAWLGFLPGIARQLLGEDLLLPQLATWWCGEPPALEYVLAHLDRLVIRPTYPNQSFEPVSARSLAGAARAELAQRLRRRPHAYVAQEHVALSQAPVLHGTEPAGLAAKAVTIRVYALAGGRIMPGGLARVADDAAINAVTTQRGGISKDIWVLREPGRTVHARSAGRTQAPQRTQAVQQLQAAPAVPLRPFSAGQEHTPSRLVENLYWFGRYSTRCEDKARLLRATLVARMEPHLWLRGVRLCERLDVIPPGADPVASLRDADSARGLAADIRRLSLSAAQIRGRLSAGAWHAVSGLQLLQDEAAAQAGPRQLLDRLLLSLAALAGFAHDDMTQDTGWRLLRIGRRLERLQFIARLLARHLAAPDAHQPAAVEWLLTACDSLRIYRPRYVAAPRLAPALDLLIRDAAHPRALTFQWQAVARDMQALEQALALTGSDGIGKPIPALDDAQLLVLEGQGAQAAAARGSLAAELLQLARAAGALSDRISLRHFSLVSLDAQALAT